MTEIITKRPEGMSFKQYKIERRNQTKRDRRRRKHGVLVYMASQITEVEFGEGKDKRKMKQYRTFMPAVRAGYDKHGQVVYKPMEKKEIS